MNINDPQRRIQQIKDEKEKWAIKSLMDIITGSFGINFIVSEGFVIELQMVACGLSTIPRPIGDLNHLRRLHLEANQIKSLRVLDKILSLEFLDLSQNQLTDLSLLGQLPCLKSLNVGENQLKTMDSLQKITPLESLNLASNQITQIIPLPELKQLKFLDLSGNPISNISNIHTLEKLIQLKLTDTQIKGEELQLLNSSIEKIKEFCRIKENAIK